MALHVIGVRHHSPACARLVAHTLRRVRPRHVLIEGPSDMNERLGELLLAHELPIAVFSYIADEGGPHASWSPFCAYSPEWVALTVAREVGAAPRFMDLPAWDDAFRGIENRYSDRHSRASTRIDALCRRLAVEDLDQLWDHLFEQPAAEEQLSERLRLYFEELRGDEHAGERDTPREAFMARCLAWALDDCEQNGGDVVVVCGGYHAPVLERLASRVIDRSWPALPVPREGARCGSYLVPYSFRRLDSFIGYESGMPSSEYQQAVWEEGVERAAEVMLGRAVTRLRKRKQAVSPADVIAASTLAQGLQRLRGHVAMSRVDLLDGLAGALVKDALEVPLPWNRRGTILPRTEPLLVEMVASFSGERVGVLAPETPRPPLLDDVRSQLEAHGLWPGPAAREVSLPLTEASGVRASRVLHRLRVLGIPGVWRQKGPAWATDAQLSESWRIGRWVNQDAMLIEASAYGATLESAAAAKLEEALLSAEGRLESLAGLLGEATFVGIHSLAGRVISQVSRAIGTEPSLASMGAALARLVALFRHDTLLGSAGTQQLALVIAAAFERGVWLLEGTKGPTAPADAALLTAVIALRDVLRLSPPSIAIAREAALASFQRCSSDREMPPALRGAALGTLWSTGSLDPGEAETQAVTAARAAARPELLGDFLAGLFALAREEVVHAPALLAAVDPAIASFDDRDFLIAAPSLRMAFAYFPPTEREAIARQVLSLHGADTSAARTMVQTPIHADAALEGLSVEAAVNAALKRFGLVREGGAS